MITVGVDLSAQQKKTGVAWMEWPPGVGRVTDLRLGASDEDLVSAITGANKSGIDCPLGWPREFIDFISQHQHDHVVVDPKMLAADWRRRLAYRVTDLHVKELPGIQGLSVSTDRIGVTTMRCAALLSMLAANGSAVDRTGAGRVVEVYPAASLVKWGLDHRRYKGPTGQTRRHELVDELRNRATWLDLGKYEELCRESDDALDAVLASLTARAAGIKQVEPIPSECHAIAAIEGWIALPTCSLDALVG
jgi:predicted nuclease with RNAse H fold